MNKQRLHNALADIPEGKTMLVVEDVFIDIYGNDNVRNIGKKKITRADVLAERYGLSVSKKGSDYIFIREA